jgi:hypothetical protein
MLQDWQTLVHFGYIKLVALRMRSHASPRACARLGVPLARARTCQHVRAKSGYEDAVRKHWALQLKAQKVRLDPNSPHLVLSLRLEYFRSRLLT